MIVLKSLIMFLMMTRFVIMMMINPFLLLMNYSDHQDLTVIIIITLDQKLSMKSFVSNQNCQNFNPSTNFLKSFILPTLTLFMTLLTHSLTNQKHLCFSNNHKHPTELPEPNKIYDHYREKLVSFHSVTYLSR